MRGAQTSLRAPVSSTPARRAIFLDRDGVLNGNVFYPDTQAYESPREPSSLVLSPAAGPALRGLEQAGFLLILVSNQPNAAKGKCTREVLDQIHARLLVLLAEQRVSLTACYYCYHHPDYTGPCACRKPSSYFLDQACAAFLLDRAQCWMIGDRASDLVCGRAAGMRTVWIDNGEGIRVPPKSLPDLSATSLADASQRVLAVSLMPAVSLPRIP